MKIEEIKIKNYRSLHEVTIYPRDILALVGKNGTGKSNILKALKFFFDGTAKDIDSECFYCHKTEGKIEVQLTFNKLTEWEKEQFLPWMDDNRLVICKEVSCDGGDAATISVIAIKKVPENVWLQESQFSGDNINEWWENKDTLRVKDSDFVAYVGGKKPKVGEWKEKAAGFVAINRDEITFVESRIENPKGYAGVLKGALPEFIYIPAVRDIQDETKVGKTNPFGQLINTVIDKITEKQKKVIEEKLKEIEMLLNRGGKERIKEITDIETLLNKLISDVMECDIEIQMPMPQLKNIFGDAKIYADDGVRTTIETKGHGLQRSMIFTIMRAYAQLAHSIKAGDKSSERTTIFAVEEPEIYLHPQSQRTLMAVFREIASGNDQVFYTTHSSTFVDIHYFDEICILMIIKEDGLPKTNVNQLHLIELLDDLEVRKGVRPTEVGIREQYSHVFNLFG
jgi:predicted ATP-dependent endonuclease of OLD family